MKPANVKYNGGQGALLCSDCRVIIKTFREFTEEETQLYSKNELPEQFCIQCQLKKYNEYRSKQDEKDCYCGHTISCDCANPGIFEFEMFLKRKLK